MKVSIKRVAKRVAAVSLALAMAFSVSPIVKTDAKAKVKAPTLNYKGTTAKEVEVYLGNSATLIVKKGTYKIKSVKWSSSKKAVATVSKKGKTNGIVKSKGLGKTTITAKVTTKKTKKKTKTYTLKTKIRVLENEEYTDPDDVWITTAPDLESLHQEMIDFANAQEGTSYKGVAVVGHMTVSGGSGTYWRILVEETGASPKYALLQIFEGADGFSEAKIFPTEIDAPSDVTIAGGWEDLAGTQELFVTKPEYNLIEEKMNPDGMVGVSIEPIAKVAKQLVSNGVFNYRVLVQKTVVAPGSFPDYYMVNVKITDTDTEYEVEVDPASAVQIHI